MIFQFGEESDTRRRVARTSVRPRSNHICQPEQRSPKHDQRRADRAQRPGTRGALGPASNLRDADLSMPNLTGARLMGAGFRMANLIGADPETDLRTADLRGAKLDWAFLQETVSRTLT
jgi:hypothetical protein